MERLRLASLLTLGALFISCGNTSLLSPELPHDIEFKSLVDGGYADLRDPLVFTVRAPADGPPDRLHITIEDAAGNAVATRNIEDPETDEPLQLDLSDIAPGQYAARFTLYGSGGVLAEEGVTFFVAEGLYEVRGVESHPSIIFPGARVSLTADLEIPEQGDPFLRWTENGNTLISGLVSEGANIIQWQAPRDLGVYTIGVEAFPFAPQQGAAFPFQSSANLNTQLYVTAAPEDPDQRLEPAESYLALYHLESTLADAAGGSDLESFGSVETLPGGLGYRLSPDSGLRAPSLLIPVDVGSVQSFTVTVGLTLESSGVEQSIVQARSQDGSLSLELRIDAAGYPVARLTLGSERIEIRAAEGALPHDTRTLLSFSVITGAETLTGMWFVGGRPIGQETIALSNQDVSPLGETIVGGFTGIVDELGVYVRDGIGRSTSDPGLFSSAMRREYGTALVLADGFDGAFLGDFFAASGQAVVKRGQLQIGPASRLMVPALSLGGGALIARIEISDVSSLEAAWEEGTLVLRPGAGPEVVPIHGSVTVTTTADTVVIATGEARLEMAGPEIPDGMKLALEGPMTASSILVYRD